MDFVWKPSTETVLRCISTLRGLKGKGKFNETVKIFQMWLTATNSNWTTKRHSCWLKSINIFHRSGMATLLHNVEQPRIDMNVFRQSSQNWMPMCFVFRCFSTAVAKVVIAVWGVSSPLRLLPQFAPSNYPSIHIQKTLPPQPSGHLSAI